MNTKSLSIILLVIIFFTSCMTPKEAYDKGMYRTAFFSASKQIKKGKNIEKNEIILRQSASALVEKEMRRDESLIASSDVKKWVKVQDRYYRLLEDLGKVNIESNGVILEEYDQLCSNKKELDFKITDYYYQLGADFLEEFYQSGNKESARDAYYMFLKAEKSGGELYYNNLADLIIESREKGIVYYVCDDANIGNSLFLQELPENAEFEPDCIIEVDYGIVNSTTNITEESKTYTDEIIVGTKEVKDTSGNIIYRSIYEDIEATVITVKVEVTLSTTTWVNVEDVTGQCSEENRSFTTSVSDTYEEIRINGDREALKESFIESEGEPSFFRSDLEDELLRKVDSGLD